MTLTKNEKEQLKRLEDRLDAIEKKLQKIQNIGIGIGIGATIFGIKAIAEIIKLFIVK